LKNRIYIGEMHHGGKWFDGEQVPILDRETFQRVQDTLKSNRIACRIKHSESGALLQGKLFDDKGNRMGPSFSGKNGVRYRFYVSTALRGRKHKAGSVARISAPEIERIVEAAVRERINNSELANENLSNQVERVVVTDQVIRVTLGPASKADAPIEIPWNEKSPRDCTIDQPASAESSKLLQAVIRAHGWLNDLAAGRYSCIEQLAAACKLHAKVVRLGLRLAFLSPDLTSAILDGERSLHLKQIPKTLPLAWSEQRLFD
jgi:hypothetical protein